MRIETPLTSGSMLDLLEETVSEHLKSTQYYFDPEKVKILTKESKDYSRKILEAIHIRQNNPSLNRHKGLEMAPFRTGFSSEKRESYSKLFTSRITFSLQPTSQ